MVMSTQSSNVQGQQIIAQGNAPFNEMSRNGGIYTVITSSAFAPVAAVPTTTAALEVWNNSQGFGNLSMQIIDIFAFQLLSTAATQTYSIWSQVQVKASPSVSSLTVFSQSGKPSYSSGATAPVITGVGTTVVAGGWRPFGNVQAWGTAAATPGNGWSAEVHGKDMVPAGGSIMVTVAGSIATASSFHVGIAWAWVNQTNN